jgi:YegS/Rv2252/BmrU family lipid kinase
MDNKRRVILNPQAGRGQAAKFRGELVQAFAHSGLAFDIEETYGPGSATTLAEAALEQGYTQIVAAGGDGTFNEVINGLMRHRSPGTTGVVLALVPMGTGNDFIKSLDGVQANDVAGAAQRIAEGNTRNIDIAKITIGRSPHKRSRYVLNDVGMGVHSLVAAETFKITRLKGRLVYILALLRALLTYRPLHLTMQYEGSEGQKTVEKRVLLTCASNGRWQGSGFQLTPHALIDDGLLDLCIMDAVQWHTIIRHLPTVLKGTHTDLPQVTMCRTERIVIASAEPLLVSCDGEIATTSTRQLEIEIVPRALEVIA